MVHVSKSDKIRRGLASFMNITGAHGRHAAAKQLYKNLVSEHLVGGFRSIIRRFGTTKISPYTAVLCIIPIPREPQVFVLCRANIYMVITGLKVKCEHMVTLLTHHHDYSQILVFKLLFT